MSELRLGVEIGFKKISIAQYENGVPRVLLSFPSVAACSNDHHDWHFGMDARSYRADSRYQSLPSIKGTLLAYGCGEKDPLLPLLLEKLFAYIKMIGETERKQCLRGVVVVLPHGLNCSPVIRQLVMDAWQKNSVMDVLCISDVSAILLAYTVQTLDRQSINTNASEPVHLLVCNADSEHCRVDVFEVIQNNHLVKFHSGQYVVWKCFARLRRHLVNAVFQHFKRAGMPELDQRMLLQLEEECVDQMALFNDPRTEKVTIRAPLQKYVMICTRKTYHAVAESSVEVVRKRVVAELTRFGLMDANTGNIKGELRLLLVGENSRLGLLRRALEDVTKSQIIAGVASYVDDAEAFGAAIASSLAGNRANIDRQELLFRLQEGLAFNLEKILRTLTSPLQEAHALVQPARDIFISDVRRDFALSGELYMGYPKEPVTLPASRLLLSTQKMGRSKVHCISLESSVNSQPVTYMRMLLGRDVRIQLRKLQPDRPDDTADKYLWIQASFTYRESAGWSNLWVFADDPSAYEPFMVEYDARRREMLNSFPSAADADKPLPNVEWPSSSSFVALVSDQLSTQHSYAIEKNRQHPSIVTVNYSFTQGVVVVVQQCQEVTGKLQAMESAFVIERPHKTRESTVDGDTVVIELTPQDCVRVSFPNEATRWDFLKKCSVFWQLCTL